ncbi:MAG: phosphonate C-P lyase system protein PhnG [Desulfovibrionaceae bacterium]|nr:phosphonate C-P lyase system protein PhnG [Desulfovibrionaceae bacterium]
MGVLARADAAALRDAARGLERRPRYAFLREPEVGMVMVRGRAGGAGVRFNLGEMTMTRCSIRLENAPELAAGLEPNGAPQRHGAAVAGPEASGPGAPGPTPAPGPVIGHAYVAGRDKAHAELAALFDALLQVPALGPRLLDTLVRELELEQAERARRRQQRTDATRVNFFTLVRGEDAEEK